MVDMTEKKAPVIWGQASASELGAALRGVGIALTTQDPSLTYSASINAPLSAAARDIVGLSDEELYPAVSRDLITCKRRVTESGKGEALDIQLPRGEATDWHRVWVEPVGLNGSGSGVICASVDISAQKLAEEHLRLALLELAHRSKNLLAVVLSIARQSANESQTLPQFSTRFVGRIRSLALAHDVLTDESWRGATVFSLVRSQLSAFSETAINQSSVEGHNAYLKPNAVQYVGLALHELIAMSVLSGALSTPGGHITVTSVLRPVEDDAGGELNLLWHETGIPAGAAIEQSSFGQTFLAEIVPAALNGRGAMSRSPGTLVYELLIPEAQFF